jgi:hypothetical protein
MSEELDKIGKYELINYIRNAIEEEKGFAMGKLGFSEQHLLGYLPFLESNPSELQIRSYEAILRYHCEIQFGVFPTTPIFLKEFAAFYSLSVRSIDILGLFQAEQEKKLIKQNSITAKLIYYQDTEPDRSIPENISNCYLPLFVNKRILYISSFADLLKERSEKSIFESVWLNTQKKWFYPKSITTIETPYSYVSAKSTHKLYGTSINLYKSICDKIDNQNFDIALIGLGALGLPLASYIKSKGKIAISLGGHLQVLFGVKGARWENDDYWKKNYFNDSWIHMPEKYFPENKDQLADNGSYW